MFFPWPRRANKRSPKALREKVSKSRRPLRLQIDPLEQRQLLAVSIAPAFVTVAEGNAGTVSQVFTVSLDAAEAAPVTVNFQTNNGVGASGATVLGNDYFATSGTLTFNPAGPLSQPITVQVRGDTLDEVDENFTVTLANFTGGGGITTGASTVTIRDDDGPAISINDIVQLEGNAGVTNFVFSMALSNSSPQPVSVGIATSVGSSTPNVDFNTTAGIVTFVPGVTQQNLTIQVLGDTQVESNETFFVDLSGAVNGTIADPQGQATIVDDEQPTLSINDVAIFEGNDDGFGSFRDMVFQVTMSRTSPTQVTVNFATQNGPGGTVNTQPIAAVDTSDYLATSGVVTFAPGETLKNVTVKIKGEDVHERDETFFVNLSGALGANLFDNQAIGTIVNDDQIPQIVIHDLSIIEDAAPTTVFPDEHQPPTDRPQDSPYTRPFSVTFTLSNPSSGTIVVNYQSIDETATGVNDQVSWGFVDFRRTFPNPIFPTDATNGITQTGPDPAFELTGQVVFAPGSAASSITLRAFRDAIDENDETFILKGSLVTPGTAPAGLSDDTGRVTIVDDDPLPTLSVANVSMVEGDTGTRFLVYTVTMGGSISERLVTVNYTTIPGTASAGVDYTPQTGTLNFDAAIAGIGGAFPGTGAPPRINGVRSLSVSVPVLGDFVDEQDETVILQLSNPVNANVGGTGAATGLIFDDDGPVINVDDVSVVEGDSGTTNAIFTVSLSATTVQTATVGFFTSNGSASAGSDYASTSGTLTYAPGETTKQVTVSVNGDTAFEGTEFFFLNLTLPTNVTINDNIGQGAILNDDVQVTIDIADASVLEGNSGQTPLVFSLTLSQASNAPIGVNYSTFSSSAQSSVDFAPIASNIVFPVGVVQVFVTVSIFGDTTVEPNEDFFVILSNPTNATVNDGTAIGTILDDDAPPTITIDDLTGIEGDAGTTPFVFTVSLSKVAQTPVSVVFTTADGSAASPADYGGGTGTLNFAPGETAKQITVTIVDDAAIESPETFFVNLSNATQAFIGDSQAVGTIIDNDSPFLRVFDESLVEGNSGSQDMVFRVTMSRVEAASVTVQFATANITASGGTDYTAASGTLTFAPGSTEQFITVPVLGDAIDEINETFNVTLSNAVGAAIFDGTAVGTILDDDGPTISINDVVVTEGNAGLVFADFTVALSFASAQDVTVVFDTADGTAVGGGTDYFSTSGTLTFTAGQLTKTLRVNVLGDILDELDETFFVNLSAPVNATLLDSLGLGTISDDDAPGIFINDTTVQELDSGLVFANFQVGLTAPTVQPVTVLFATADNTAQQNADYFPTQITLTFNPGGPTLLTVPVQIVPDSLPEADESFFINLSNPTGGATFTDPQALATILDDDTRISINDVTITEGDAGTQNLVFSVTMNQPRASTVTVQFASSNGTATAGQDFNNTSGTITFAAGQTLQSLTVQVRGDLIDEPTETFDVVLSNPVNAFQGDFIGTATILDNGDPQPIMSVGNATFAEGNSGLSNGLFTVLLSGLSGRNVTAVFSTADGTAINGVDYNATTGTLTFLPGETSKQIAIPLIGDTIVENNETFTLNLSNITFATPATLAATGTIADDDASLSITSVTVVEGNTTTNAVFSIQLSKATSVPVTLDFTTNNGSAIAGSDYNSTAGSLTMTPGQTSVAITVQVIGDTIDENNETFTLDLSNIVGATVVSSVGTGTIIDDDLPPDVTISDTTVLEGDAGVVNAVFTVSLAQASGKTITVVYTTNDGTALAGLDYQAASGTLTFLPGENNKPIQVLVNGDLLLEPNEAFFVDLIGVNNANPADVQGVGTIIDDEPRMSVADSSLVEGNSGTQFLVFGVSLTKAAGPGNITVNYNTVPGSGTAADGVDYTGVSGVLTFFPGDNSRTVSVPVIGDVLNEADETFTLFLSGPSGAILTSNQATGTIINDDPLPQVSINDVSQIEGDSGLSNFFFTISLDAPSGRPVILNYNTANGIGGSGATAGSDYQARSGALTFLPGETSIAISVPVVGDPNVEPSETFFVNLSSLVNATFADNQGIGTIINDEPQLFIGDATVSEQDSGPVGMVFPITLSRASGIAVTVVLNTANQTAAAPNDYAAVSNATLTFAAGQTSQNLTVLVQGDLLDEDDETFFLNLSGASAGASIGDPQGLGTILDNDASPTISVSLATTLEGNSGQTNAIFSVMLSTASGRAVTVAYQTADGTATVAGFDYFATAGSLTFSPGSVVQNVTVAVRGDTLGEGDETYFLNLSNPVNATFTSSQGVGTIIDDEPRVALGDSTLAEGDSGTSNMTFLVTLSAPATSQVTVVYSTSDGTALQGADYISASGTLTFAIGSVFQTIAVPIVGDLADEDDETFTVTLSGISSNASIFDGTGIGTITDNDPIPDITVNDLTVDEGDGLVQAQAVFTVSLSAASGRTVQVGYATADVTASNSSDYVPVLPAVLTFAPGEMAKNITVLINGDTLAEVNETFDLRLSNPINANLRAPAKGVATIRDDEPRITISDVSIAEGNVGTQDMVFNVLLSGPSAGTVTVAFATQNGGGATAGLDYTATSGTLTFLPSQLAQFITVQVLGDTLLENDETFLINLSNASNNALIAKSQGLGLIDNDDAPPGISVADSSVTEGDFGTKNMIFTVTLSPVSGQAASVLFSTSAAGGANPATAGQDYTTTAGTLNFAVGETVKLVTVRITGDTAIEQNEAFLLNLSSPTGAVLGASPAVGTIVDNDASISIGAASLKEGDFGFSNMVFPVTLSKAVDKAVTANFATANGVGTAAAVAGADFNGTAGSLSFAAGETSKNITVQILGETINEPDETFSVNLSSVVNALVQVNAASGTIRDDDGLPKISINDITVLEGNAGTSNAVFTVSLDQISGQDVSVVFNTTNGSALAGSDYLATSGAATIPAGQISAQVIVPIIGDTTVEARETFTVTLTNAVNGTIIRSTATATIEDNELTNFIMTGAGAGGGPHVVARQSVTLNTQYSFFSYAPTFTGGVRVASGDVNGDGQADMIVGAGVGGGPHVRVIDGKTGQQITEFFAFEPTFTGGVFVAAGDTNLDGRAEVFVSADGAGANGRVRVFNGLNGSMLRDIVAPAAAFSGGSRVAAGDVNGDGRSDIILGASKGSTPRVMVLDEQNGAIIADFFAYNPAFLGGVFVAAGDITGDGRADIVTGADSGGGPQVSVFDGATRQQIQTFFAYGASFSGGVRVATTDFNGDGLVDIITGAGPGGGPHVRIVRGDNLQQLASFFAYAPTFTSGIYVGGSLRGPGNPLRSAESGTDADAASLTSDQLQPLLNQAVSNWIAQRPDAADRLRGMNVQVADLADGYLGMAFANAIYVDLNADGHGWFVDATPGVSEEYERIDGQLRARDNSAAARHMDLLSVIEHELGHILGLEDLSNDDHDIMAAALSLGTRSSSAAVDSIFGNEDW